MTSRSWVLTGHIPRHSAQVDGENNVCPEQLEVEDCIQGEGAGNIEGEVGESGVGVALLCGEAAHLLQRARSALNSG